MSNEQKEKGYSILQRLVLKLKNLLKRRKQKTSIASKFPSLEAKPENLESPDTSALKQNKAENESDLWGKIDQLWFYLRTLRTLAKIRIVYFNRKDIPSNTKVFDGQNSIKI